MTPRTTDPAWRERVEAMVERARAHQEEFFYRTTLPGWEAELRAIQRDDARSGGAPEGSGDAVSSTAVAAKKDLSEGERG